MNFRILLYGMPDDETKSPFFVWSGVILAETRSQAEHQVLADHWHDPLGVGDSSPRICVEYAKDCFLA